MMPPKHHRLRLRLLRLLLLLPLFLRSALVSAQDLRDTLPILPISLPFRPDTSLSLFPSTFLPTLQHAVDDPIFPFQPTRQILFKDSSLDAQFTFALLSEPQFNVTDYETTIICDQPHVLNASDVVLAPPVLMPDGKANFTANLAFERQVGEATMTILFHRPDASFYTSIVVHYTICGISFFHLSNKRLTFLSDNHLLLSSHSSISDQPQQLVFYCLIQYPDGSTSQSVLSSISQLPPLSDISIQPSNNEILTPHTAAKCNTFPPYHNDSFRILPSCAFGITPLTEASEPHFIVALRPLRHGTCTFDFVWPDFAKAISGEVYETSLSIAVVGSSKPGVTAIAPPGPFRPRGGQIFRCLVVNANVTDAFRFELAGGTLQPVSVVRTGYFVTVSFVTPPGSGADIVWDLQVLRDGKYVTCPWTSDSSRFEFNYLTQDIYIESITPTTGPASGGTTIICTGYFANMTISEISGDALVLGSYHVEADYITSISEKELVFRLPPRRIVRPPAHDVECFVIVNGLHSNAVKFWYEALTSVSLFGAGASYSESNNTFLIPFCAKDVKLRENASFDLRARANSEADIQFLQFEWTVANIASKQEVFTAAGGAEEQVVMLPLNLLHVGNVYRATVRVSDKRYEGEVITSILLEPTFKTLIGVGMHTDDTRTLAYPPVDPRFMAVVTDVGNCFGDMNGGLSYEWTYQSKSTVLSFKSIEIDVENASPKRFGREYMIPREHLIYGTHDVSVKVFYTDNPEAFGVASGWLRVDPSPLKPVIGGGESFVRVSSASDLVISGRRSYDPDASTSTSTDGLLHYWTCELSVEGGREFTREAECPSELFPAAAAEYGKKDEFVVLSEHLQGMRGVGGKNASDKSVFVRYSLYLKKVYEQKGVGSRTSSRVWQIVEVVQSIELIPRLTWTRVTTPEGAEVDREFVPYFDSIMLTPQASGEIVWQYRLITPAKERFSVLQKPSNLILSAGYYTPNSFSARHSLGLQRNTLQPGTEYSFLVELESPNSKILGASEIAIRTRERESVQFLKPKVTKGDRYSVFFAHAVATGSTTSRGHKFYFYIDIQNGSELCLDGCSGHRNIAFQVPLPGRHRIRCVLVDAQGRYVIARAEQSYEIEILDNSKDGLQSLNTSLQTSFVRGDHGSFMIGSAGLAQLALTNGKEEDREEVGDMIEKCIERLGQLFRKSVCSGALSRDYLFLTRLISSLPVGDEVLSGSRMFYNVLRMLYDGVARLGGQERYDNISDDVSVAMKHLRAHALQIASGGTSKGRVREELKGYSSVVNDKLLSVSESSVELWQMIRGRSGRCGERTRDFVGDFVNISVQTVCNKEHGLSLDATFSSLKWCNSLYNKDGLARKRVVLAEYSEDFVQESGVLNMREAKAHATTGLNGSVALDSENMISHGKRLVRGMIRNGDGSEVKLGRDCAYMRQYVQSTNDIFVGYGVNSVICSGINAIDYRNRKQLDVRLPKNGYFEEDLPGVNGSVKTGAFEQNATWITSHLERINDGLYGVKRKGCLHLHPSIWGVVRGGWIGLVAIAVVLTSEVVLIGIGKWCCVKVTVVAAEEESYIERDAYGRNVHGIVEEVEDGADEQQHERLQQQPHG